MTPLETVRSFISSIERGDLDAALALVGDNCEYDNVPMSKIIGRDAIRTALGPFLSACSKVQWTITREAATGGVVFNERVDRFVMPHGEVAIPVSGVWEVVDGKITLWRDYFDLATFQGQMPAA